jgi:hypothetical protein
MKIHRHAKTNMYQRRLLITRVRRRGWTQRRAAEAAGVSATVVPTRASVVAHRGPVSKRPSNEQPL